MALGARLGTGYVDIKGDFSPLERQLAQKMPAFGRYIDSAFEGRSVDRFGKRVDAADQKTTRLGKSLDGVRAKVTGIGDEKVDLDTKEFDRKAIGIRKELAEIAALKADPDVDLDTSSFTKREKLLRAEMARISAMKAEVKIDTDGASAGVNRLGGSIFQTNARFSALRNTISTLRLPVLVGTFGAAAEGAIAAAGGVVSLVSALGPLSGALVGVPQGLLATAQAGGVLALAASGVGDALSAMSDEQLGAGAAAQTSAAQQEAAARQVESAEQSLADAKRQAKYAEEDLTAAREEAVRNLEDLRTAAISATDAEKGSALALREARKELAEARAAGPGEKPDLLELRQLQQRVTEARHAHAAATIDSKRAEEDLTRAEKAGVSGSEQVVAARRAQEDAERNVQRATEALADAQKDAAQQMSAMSSASSTLEEKLAALPPAAREFTKYLFGLKPQLDDLRETAAAGLFPGVESGIDHALKNLPVLDKVLGATAEEMGDVADETGRWLGREGFGRDFESLGETNVRLIDRFGAAALNLADALRDVMIEGEPLIDWMSRGIESWSEWVEQEARAGRQTGRLNEFFKDSRHAIADVVSIGGSLFNILMDIGHASKPFGDDMLNDLRQGANELERITGSVEGQNKLSAYFEDSHDKLEAFGDALLDIADEGSLTESIDKAIELAIPVIAEHAGELGIAVAKGLAHGFTESNVWGKLFTAAAFIRLLGGPGALRAVGGGIAGKILGGAAAAAGSSTVAGRVTSGLTAPGTTPARPLFVAVVNQGGVPGGPGGGPTGRTTPTPPPTSGSGGASTLSKLGEVLKFGLPFAGGAAAGGAIIIWRDKIAKAIGESVPFISEKGSEAIHQGLLRSVTDQTGGHGSGSVFDSPVIDKWKDGILKTLDLDQGLAPPGSGAAPQRKVDLSPFNEDLKRLVELTDIAPRNLVNRLGLDPKTLKESGVAISDTRVSLKDLGDGTVDLGKLADGVSKKWAHDIEGSMKKSSRDVADFADVGADALLGFAKDSDRSTDRTGRDHDRLQKSFDRTGDDIVDFGKRGSDAVDRFTDGVGRDFDRAGDNSGRMAKRVSGNVFDLADAVKGGMENIGENTVEATSKLAGKKLDFSFKSVNKSISNVVGRQQGGRLVAKVPGTRDGDRNLLSLNGNPLAFIEDQEGIFIGNRTYTAALEEGNRNIPRRKDGGHVTTSGLTAPFNVDGAKPGFVPFMNFLNSQYGPLFVMSGLRPGAVTTTGNVSNHASGHAVDISTHESGVEFATGPSSLKGPGAARMDALHSYMARNITLPGDFLWRTLEGGNHFNHIHRGITSVEADDPQKMIAYLSKLPGGAGLSALKRVIITGPDGPLKTIGQGGLDLAYRAAKEFVNRHAMTPSFGKAGGISFENIPPKLEKYNHRFPAAMFPSEAWNQLYQMPFDAVAALAEWRGTPGVTMAQVSEGEGNLRPGSRSSDNGWGLWGITSPFADSFGVGDLGGYQGMLNPVSNAIVMGRMYPQGWSGGSPWYGTGHVTGYDQHYKGALLRKYGGLVPHLKDGGKPEKGKALPPRINDDRIMKLRRALSKLTADEGPIARLDERIAISETRDALGSSPAGSELSESELAGQIRLNERLKKMLGQVNRIAGTGEKLSKQRQRFPISQQQRRSLRMLEGTFHESLVEISGLTGKGGRLLDVGVKLDELRGTRPAFSSVDLAGLRSVIEARDFGAFAGVFGDGGKIPAGQVGVVGERGVPELVHGPATVTPIATPNVEVILHGDLHTDGRSLEEAIEVRMKEYGRSRGRGHRQRGVRTGPR